MENIQTLTITLHDTDNCGSSLQAYALQYFLTNQGIQNKIIDYVPSYTQNNGRAIRALIRNIVFFKYYVESRRRFKLFIKNNLKLTKKYRTLNKLEKDTPYADVYIAGSDQLWNDMYECGKDPAFYLNFVKDKPKITYAISFGREKIPAQNQEIIQKYASDFKWISVREKSGVEQVKEVLKVSDENCPLVCDPVLLNDCAVYKRLMSERIVEEDYLFIYLANEIDVPCLNRVVNKIKKDANLKVVFAGPYRKVCDCDIHLRVLAPEDFLSLIYNAKYVISNSFHASVFSVLYEKQFFTILPPKNGARIQDMMNLLGLEKQILRSDESMELKDISNEEYANALKVLNEFSKTSGNQLIEIINRFK